MTPPRVDAAAALPAPRTGYCVADNLPYGDHDFATGETGPPHDCAALVNDSPNNTGARELPPAEGALLFYSYSATPPFEIFGAGGEKTSMAGPTFHLDALPSVGGEPPDGAFPSYFDDLTLVYDWSRSTVFTVHLDDDGAVAHVEPVFASVPMRRPTDMAFGPDGQLYVLEYGSEWGARNVDARLVRLAYEGRAVTPRAALSVTPTSGPVPLTVTASAAGSSDPNGDPLSYAWRFDGDGVVDATRQGAPAAPRLSRTGAGAHASELLLFVCARGVGAPLELELQLLFAARGLVLDRQVGAPRHGEARVRDLDAEGLCALERVGEAAQGLDEAGRGAVSVDVTVGHRRGIPPGA